MAGPVDDRDDDDTADPASGPSDEEVDRRFAELMAGLQPSSVDDDAPARPSAADDAAPTAPPVARPVGGPRDYAVADEPEEGFEPPEPTPISTADPFGVIAWGGAICGPIALVLLVVVWPGAPPLVWATVLAVTLLGWGLALWRLPRNRRDDADDDGAVV